MSINSCFNCSRSGQVSRSRIGSNRSINTLLCRSTKSIKSSSISIVSIYFCFSNTRVSGIKLRSCKSILLCVSSSCTCDTLISKCSTDNLRSSKSRDIRSYEIIASGHKTFAIISNLTFRSTSNRCVLSYVITISGYLGKMRTFITKLNPFFCSVIFIKDILFLINDN